MDDITQVFINLLEQTGSPDMAESEFKRMIADDHDLRDLYRQWCSDVGSNERNGFFDFCDEYLRDHDELWDGTSEADE